MSSANRPLSPHLQIYRWQLTSVLSILHRMTGVFLSAGAVVLVWWLFAAAMGDAEFAVVQTLLASTVGKLFLLGWTFSLFYHLANGIRHLLWDTGFGFDIKTAYVTGWTVVAAAVALTAFAWTCPLLRP
ncbi:MAG TPA: succinate dehydrogenase, cytochrome b556 subunit [Alphaproteobacteria bacterium]|jgi:succinate dehydrogenase / fumarate reductase cytochrome b subunit|nr:succinate dehydrogenase, cytochrome b556 subunit [Alphaproteobacteria bacterium]